MLKNLLAVFAAAAVALGVSVGVADAAVPTFNDNCQGTNLLSCNGGGVLSLGGTSGLLGNTGGPLGLGVVPGLRRHWPWHPGLGGAYGWSPYLNGSYLNLEEFGGPAFSEVAVCPYSTFGRFSGVYRGRFGNRWPRVANLFNRGGRFGGFDGGYGALRAQACGGGVVPVPTPVAVPVPEPVYDPGYGGYSSCGCAAPASYMPTEPNNGNIVSVPNSAPSAGDSGLAPDAVRVK